MSSGQRSEDYGVVPLFPLPDTVLFPHGVLPLHIFEPRYRQMTNDALAGDRRIAMAVPRSRTGKEPIPILPIVCVGAIRHEQRLSDGRYNLMLCGESRFRVHRELPIDRLYRLAEGEFLFDNQTSRLQSRRCLQRAEILSSLQRFLPADNEIVVEFMQFLHGDCPPGIFADVVAYAAPLPPQIKAELLSNCDVDDRLTILTDELRKVAKEPLDPAPLDFPSHFTNN